MNIMPNLRPSASREHVEPADRREQLNRREDALDRRERELDREARSLREERQRLDQRQRELERAATAAELAAEHGTDPRATDVADNVLSFDTRSPAQIEALAKRLVDAGRKRRGELADALPEPSTEAERLAARIIQAGRRRRGEID